MRRSPMLLACPLTAFLIALASAAQLPAVGEKGSRTPAQQKINSQLLYEVYRVRGEANRKGVPPAATRVDVDARGRALVDIRAHPAPALLTRIRHAGGVVVSTSTRDRSILARVPLLELETLAADPRIRFIEPAAEATTVRQPG